MAPARDPTLRLLALLLPAAFSMYAIFQAAQVVLLPLQMEAFDPVHKVGRLAALTTLCSATSIAGLVCGGAISDVTRSRWGRRRPWLAVMGAASALLLVAAGRASSLFALTVETALLWFTLNYYQAVLLAIIPDRVAPERRALASWAFGFGGPVGVLIGVNLAAFLSPRLSYLVLAALLAISVTLFVTLAPEPASLHTPLRQKSGRGIQALATLGESFRHHDFALAFLARALAFLAQYMVGGYLLYALQDYLSPAALPQGQATTAVAGLNTMRTTASVAMLILAGWSLQQTEKRRAYFAAFAALTAIAFAAPAISASWSAILASALIGGVAWGVFSSVDLAILSQVLPNPDAAGRDIGLLGVAGAAPQLFAPALGAFVISVAGYAPMFALAAMLSLGAGALALRLRAVP